ncbi:hypothetical protein QOT17_007932 [Balamuthia mandrillaris]
MATISIQPALGAYEKPISDLVCDLRARACHEFAEVAKAPKIEEQRGQHNRTGGTPRLQIHFSLSQPDLARLLQAFPLRCHSSFTEMFWDTPNRTLLRNNWWLKVRDNSLWSLKICQPHEDCLTYTELKTKELIVNKLKELLPDVENPKDPHSLCKTCFAYLVTTRYTLLKDAGYSLYVDCTRLAKKHYHVLVALSISDTHGLETKDIPQVDSFHPVKPVRSKVLEWLYFHSKDNLWPVAQRTCVKGDNNYKPVAYYPTDPLATPAVESTREVIKGS